MIYAGCDNGLTGGLVALSETAGLPPISMIPMPIKAKGKGNEVDALAVWEWMQSLHSELCVVIETPGKHSPGLMALCSMWDSYGALRAICEVKGIRHIRISPQTWQSVMLPGCEKGNTKPYALSVARQLWPQETWLATPRCKKPSDGLVDGALIAEFARRKGL